MYGSERGLGEGDRRVRMVCLPESRAGHAFPESRDSSCTYLCADDHYFNHYFLIIIFDHNFMTMTDPLLSTSLPSTCLSFLVYLLCDVQ